MSHHPVYIESVPVTAGVEVRPSTPVFSEISSAESDTNQTLNLGLLVARWNFGDLSFPELDFLEIPERLTSITPSRALDTSPNPLSDVSVTKAKPVEDMLLMDFSVSKEV